MVSYGDSRLMFLIMLLEDRVLWFRTRAARDRWKEEATLLETESRRLLRGLSSMAATWKELPSLVEPVQQQGFAVYAYRRAHAHARTPPPRNHLLEQRGGPARSGTVPPSASQPAERAL